MGMKISPQAFKILLKQHIETQLNTMPTTDKIPELEEDWDNGQFDDAESTLITHHNTYSESE